MRTRSQSGGWARLRSRACRELRPSVHAQDAAVLSQRRADHRDQLLRPGPFGTVLGRRARIRARPGGQPDLPEPDPGRRPGIEVLLQRTGDDKRQKNRLHLDLRTASPEGEVERILGLGASLLTGHPVIEHGWRWHILADPDGNEFCVLQPPADSPSNELTPHPVGGRRVRPVRVMRMLFRRAGHGPDDLSGKLFGVDEHDCFCRQLLRGAGACCREIITQDCSRFGV